MTGRKIAKPVKAESAEAGGSSEVEPAGFGRSVRGRVEIEDGETRRVIPQHEETSGRTGDGGESIELCRSAAGKGERNSGGKVVAEQFAEFTARDEQGVVVAGELVKGYIGTGGQDFRKPAGRKINEAAAAGKALDRGERHERREHWRIGGILRVFRGRRIDAGFGGRRREHEGRVEIAVGLREEIGDLGVAVFLKQNRWNRSSGRGGDRRGENVDVTLGRRAGSDAAVWKPGKATDIAVSNLAKNGNAFSRQNFGIVRLSGGHASSGKNGEVDVINAGGIAGGDEGGCR